MRSRASFLFTIQALLVTLSLAQNIDIYCHKLVSVTYNNVVNDTAQNTDLAVDLMFELDKDI